MKKFTRNVASAAALLALAAPLSVFAADNVDQRIQELQKELDALKTQIQTTDSKLEKVEQKSLGRWLEISGDYRFRFDSLRGDVADHFSVPTYLGALSQGMDPMSAQMAAMTSSYKVKDDSMFTNRFGLNLKAKATENVTVNARLLMYKVTGAQDDASLQTDGIAYSFDRAGAFDGTLGHVPGSNNLAVDRAYATWNNIADQPIWFSVGRRPSTGGNPSFLKNNTEPMGVSGVPALLVDYAFDGATLGWAPDIDGLPGSYIKLCYGRGYENGITEQDSGNGIKDDTDMLGINVVPYDTDALRVEMQYNRGMDIFSNPIMLTGSFAPMFTDVYANIGDIDWYGLNFQGKIKNAGPGNLHWFINGAISETHPADGFDDNLMGMYTLLCDVGDVEDKSGWAVYLGGRYDFKSGTKLGFEYNHGSKNWITFAPAADDMWTAKLGTRGNVYEAYIIQDLPLKAISSYFAKTFFKLGYQYYDFDYTGSNSWLGAPVKISDLNVGSMQMTAPMSKAQDIYATFEVQF
jgi:uncharacterized small protein (DUF1192 family)